MKFLWNVYLLLGLFFLFTCSRSPTAGGSTDSGNVKFAGVFCTDSGVSAADVLVTLCLAEYNAATDTNSTVPAANLPRKTVTDKLGQFQFDSVPAGHYYIEGNDRKAKASAAEITIENSTVPPLYFKSTLYPYAVVKGNIGRSNVTTRYILIYGFDRKIPVDSEGDFCIADLPVGEFRFKIASPDTSFLPIDIDRLALASGDTTATPCFGWQHHRRIFMNTTPSGADITGTVVDFPVLVRLTKNNFEFGEAAPDGRDCRFIKPDGSRLPCTIERWDPEKGSAEIWVKIDTVHGNDNSRFFTMYWGNGGLAPQPRNQETVFDTCDGFQLVWHLSDEHCDSATDATHNHFDGSPAGMTDASVVEGIIGKARLFNGMTSSIAVKNSAEGKLNFPQDGRYTLSAWVYAENLDGGSRVIASKGDEQYFLCTIEGASGVSKWSFTEYKDKIGWSSTTAQAAGGQWVLLTGVQDGTSQYLYINGVLADSGTSLTPATKSRITTFDVAIGKFMENGLIDGDGYFEGMLDEIRIANVPLNADWIRLCYINQQAEDRLLEFRNE